MIHGGPLWDKILANGWAPEFAAGAVLHQLPFDQFIARWYYDRLQDMCRGVLLPPNCEKESRRQRAVGRACAVLVKLQEELTAADREALMI